MVAKKQAKSTTKKAEPRLPRHIQHELRRHAELEQERSQHNERTGGGKIVPGEVVRQMVTHIEKTG